jgi:prepilin-type N-terminal cleavage/methylation domain-containing protein
MKIRKNAAMSLIEVLMALAVLGLILALGLPELWNGFADLRVRLAAGEVAGVMHQARIYAMRHSANVALRFETQGRQVFWTLYRDGDGDGVRTNDILRGVDPAVGPPSHLAHFGDRVKFGFPRGPAPREISDPRKTMRSLDDPIRFNGTDLASFSSLGTATPGTVYLTDGRKMLYATRVSNLSGKVTIWRYVMERQEWRRR